VLAFRSAEPSPRLSSRHFAHDTPPKPPGK
jgi:hypothetical protein